jgi:hypothetical protein
MGLNAEALVKSVKYTTVFLETGSYKGCGISGGLNVGFPKVISIELAEEFYKECLNRFEGHIKSGRVSIVHGDSLVMMPELIKMANGERITFYLDAHHYIEESGCGVKWCPLVEEIHAIRDSGRKDHIIMVDDISCAQRGEFEFPPEKDIIDAIMEINPEYRLTYEDCIRSKDLLVAWPPDVLD